MLVKEGYTNNMSVLNAYIGFLKYYGLPNPGNVYNFENWRLEVQNKIENTCLLFHSPFYKYIYLRDANDLVSITSGAPQNVYYGLRDVFIASDGAWCSPDEGLGDSHIDDLINGLYPKFMRPNQPIN